MREAFEIGGTKLRRNAQEYRNSAGYALYAYPDDDSRGKCYTAEKRGPRLFVCAALHGDEINGIEIIRRILENVQIGE